MFDKNYEKRNFPVIRPDWLAKRTEAVLLPELAIVDSHHHFWDVEGAAYHGADLVADASSGHRITATVYVEGKARYRDGCPAHLRPVGETEFAVAQSESVSNSGIKVCQGIVGYADLHLGSKTDEALERHCEAGRGRFRGVRSRAAWSVDPILQGPADGPPPGLLLDPAFQQGVLKLAALGLSLDVWVYHTQLKEVAQLAAACPSTQIILNHAGGPLGIGPFTGKREEVFKAWRQDIEALTPLSNVAIKLGGLGMPRIGFPFADAEIPVASETLAQAWAPYFEVCIEAAGPDRCLFESNFPVDKGMCSYQVIWNSFKRVAMQYSDDERNALFHGTASRIYKLARE